MIYLSRGQLKKLSERVSLFAQSSYSSDKGDVIRLSFEDELTIVQCTKVVSVKSKVFGAIYLCWLWDGEETKPAIIDPNCNMGDQSFQVGTFIIIEEISFYKFRDLKIEAKDDFDEETLSREIMVVNNSKIIGFEKVDDIDENDDQGIQVNEDQSEEATCLIAQLNENMKKSSFTLKVFVEKKSPIKNFASANPENGRRIRLKLTDHSSSIEIVAFNDDCDALNLLQLNNWYMVKNVVLIKINKKFLEWPDDCVSKFDLRYIQGSEFELTKNPKVTDTSCQSKDSKTHQFFTPLNELINYQIGASVNVLGVIIKVNDVHLKQFSANRSGEKKKDIEIRNILIKDSSNTAVPVAFWGKQAKEFNMCAGTIISFTDVLITDFLGITLSVTKKSSTFDQSDNKGPEIEKLRKWISENSDKEPIPIAVLKTKKRHQLASSRNNDINPSPTKKVKSE